MPLITQLHVECNYNIDPFLYTVQRGTAWILDSSYSARTIVQGRQADDKHSRCMDRMFCTRKEEEEKRPEKPNVNLALRHRLYIVGGLYVRSRAKRFRVIGENFLEAESR
jgi:hypothetical protein